jgi:outer membrane protein OmpA-like peptidoglycan-associated protein
MSATGFRLDLTFNLARRPIRTIHADFAPNEEVIDLLFAGHLHAAYAITDWVEIDLAMAVLQFAKTGAGLDALGAGAGDNRLFSLGDLWIEGRFTPLKAGKHGINLGVAPFITFPTGNPNILLTAGVPTLGAKVALGRSWERFRIGGHFGYRFKPGFAGLGSNFAADDEVFYSLAVGVSPLVGKVDVFAELSGAGVVGPGVDELEGAAGQAIAHSPLELLVSGRFQFKDKLALLVGGGPGLTAGVGSPEGRVFVGLSYAPPPDRDGDGILDNKDDCPTEPEDFDEWEDADGCPDADNDEDGLLDGDDSCPDEPEDRDGYKDADGCPDPDNDDDGILDGADDCPNEPEDIDGWEDADGCPDLDNDFDEIPDTEDDCPMSTEDFDGWQDDDGCPEDDNDGDGFLDFEDLCPNRAEVFNDFRDEDGCPDDVVAVVTEGKIVILQRILFKFGKDRILKRSRGVLEAVALRLGENPQIRKIRVEGHTDSKGRATKNLALSKKRARAVVKALVKAGVDPGRLEYEGFGESVPLADNDSEDGRRRNRRVEFTIIAQDDVSSMRGVSLPTED